MECADGEGECVNRHFFIGYSGFGDYGVSHVVGRRRRVVAPVREIRGTEIREGSEVKENAWTEADYNLPPPRPYWQNLITTAVASQYYE